MKRVAGQYGARRSSDGGASAQLIKPRIDYSAKWHDRFDRLMSDEAHRKKMDAVRLPKIILREPDWDVPAASTKRPRSRSAP